ncbi:hypothetical protein NZD89_24130 [Alicyclobacillus fastidiosus]|uniref:Uncharacterized protein n=1 Tax=Alicyclobacillus fastidiosus TaxID=392011 RepID=A0ABY6ZEN5_9BACL|nr:hypothetical protein [Alicyclobacillus fastidiosus]WAH41311.1 hypothetical protein NZD89_24130 [Alicyclobacillus fastidiosus]GMA62914.1 hypothetical protein GCM10025859_33540 [Alicyclobacillus fastidiosus]
MSKHSVKSMLAISAALTTGLITLSPTLAAAGVEPSQQVNQTTPATQNLWIKFSKAKTLLTADIQNSSPDVQLAATTLRVHITSNNVQVEFIFSSGRKTNSG